VLHNWPSGLSDSGQGTVSSWYRYHGISAGFEIDRIPEQYRITLELESGFGNAGVFHRLVGIGIALGVLLTRAEAKYAQSSPFPSLHLAMPDQRAFIPLGPLP
jgi:hypothetical protein